MKSFLARQNWTILLVVILVVAAVSAPVYAHRIMTPTDNDYGTHIQFALDLLKHQPVPAYTLAHPIIQFLLIGILWLSRGKVGLWVGLILIQVAAQILTALILYFWFGRLPGRWGDALRAFWAVTLTLVAPLMILAPIDGQYYFGYVGLANYHNPTVHLLRPFALVSFMFAVQALEIPPLNGRGTAANLHPFWMVLLSAAVVVFSALIKPNYALCILPALALLAGIRFLRKMPVDWRLVLGGLILPACLVLAVQGIITYADGGSIIFQPFVVESAYSSYLPVKFLLSIIFPAAALAAYFPQIRKNQEMLLAWTVFVAGALQMYLLAESGSRLEHGNFRWSAQIGLFLLFAASVRFFLRCIPWPGSDRAAPSDPFSRRRVWVMAAYLAHIIAGLVYYVRAFTANWYG